MRARPPDWTTLTLRTSPCASSTAFWPTPFEVSGKSSARRGGLAIEKLPGTAAGGAFIWMRSTVALPC